MDKVSTLGEVRTTNEVRTLEDVDIILGDPASHHPLSEWRLSLLSQGIHNYRSACSGVDGVNMGVQVLDLLSGVLLDDRDSEETGLRSRLLRGLGDRCRLTLARSRAWLVLTIGRALLPKGLCLAIQWLNIVSIYVSALKRKSLPEQNFTHKYEIEFTWKFVSTV
ncbi:hypothetical protein Acr_28g0001370 [Actinidia rufa]|uniref:Uncharacterized protein n=1 Tax=Actinidia rufa TaxID=165716 RepID=A0A7J0H8K2_9ERIC|nr:hypothetical protein Acr_28g0001370 [Actinidia rufa]